MSYGSFRRLDDPEQYHLLDGEVLGGNFFEDAYFRPQDNPGFWDGKGLSEERVSAINKALSGFAKNLYDGSFVPLYSMGAIPHNNFYDPDYRSSVGLRPEEFGEEGGAVAHYGDHEPVRAEPDYLPSFGIPDAVKDHMVSTLPVVRARELIYENIHALLHEILSPDSERSVTKEMRTAHSIVIDPHGALGADAYLDMNFLPRESKELIAEINWLDKDVLNNLLGGHAKAMVNSSFIDYYQARLAVSHLRATDADSNEHLSYSSLDPVDYKRTFSSWLTFVPATIMMNHAKAAK